MDTKQRLSTLQMDFQALQDSYESLESSKASLLAEHELEIQRLVSHKEKLERRQMELVIEARELQEKSSVTLKHFELCQSTLDQSEAAVVELKAALEERHGEITKLRILTKTSCRDSHQIMSGNGSIHSSPEVISDTDAPVQDDQLPAIAAKTQVL